MHAGAMHGNVVALLYEPTARHVCWLQDERVPAGPSLFAAIIALHAFILQLHGDVRGMVGNVGLLRWKLRCQ
jgi:hypothetical protein